MTKAKSNKLKWVLSIVSVILSLATLIGVIVGINNLADTTKFNTTSYSIGAIDETGRIIESRKSIYSDMATIDDMEIVLDEDATITYKVVFYDEDINFISMTDALETDFDTTTTPENAKHFRVVITPYQIDGEDTIVNVFNMSKYTKMLNITFANNK